MQQGDYKEEEKTEEEEAASCHVPLLHNRKKLHLAMNDGGLLFYDIDIYIIIYIYSIHVRYIILPHPPTYIGYWISSKKIILAHLSKSKIQITYFLTKKVETKMEFQSNPPQHTAER